MYWFELKFSTSRTSWHISFRQNIKKPSAVLTGYRQEKLKFNRNTWLRREIFAILSQLKGIFSEQGRRFLLVGTCGNAGTFQCPLNRDHLGESGPPGETCTFGAWSRTIKLLVFQSHQCFITSFQVICRDTVVWLQVARLSRGWNKMVCWKTGSVKYSRVEQKH